MTATDPVSVAFAESLVRLRTGLGLTKRDLAVLAGVDGAGLARIENKITGTTLATAGQLAAALGTTVAAMITAGGAATAPRPPAPRATTMTGAA